MGSNHTKKTWLKAYGAIIGLIIASTLVFFIFSFLQSGPDIIEADILVPLTSSSLKSGLILSHIKKNIIEVRIRGPKPIVKQLSDEKIVYCMNLNGLTAGRHNLAVQADAFGFAKGIKVLSIEPSTVSLSIEKELKKTLPILIKFTGDPGPDFYIADKIVKPTQVMVLGPESILAPVNELMTKPIDIKGVSESFRKECALNLKDGIKLLEPGNPIIVNISVKEKQIEKKYKAIPVKGENTSYRFSLTPKNASITVQGPKSQLQHFDPTNSINVYIDLKDLKPGIYVRRATIALPVNLVLLGIEPENFTAIIHDEKSAN